MCQIEGSSSFNHRTGGVAMKFTRCGLDIAKQVFQIHGVNEHGVVKARKTLARAKVLEYFAQVPPCLIGIEACGGAHYWARELGKLGHTVKLMAAQFVTAYRKRGKNDVNDAEAICEAVGRPNTHASPGRCWPKGRSIDLCNPRGPRPDVDRVPVDRTT